MYNNVMYWKNDMTQDYELTPENINDIVNYARLREVVRISIELKLYDRLRKPLTLEKLSAALKLDGQFLEYLLDVLENFGYVVKSGERGAVRYQNSALSSQYLDRKSPMYLGDDILDRVDTAGLLEAFIHEGPVSPKITKRHWTKDRLNSIAAMTLLGGVQSAVSAIDLAGRKNMLDIGGGHGLYSIFLTKKHKGLRSRIIELPGVVSVAREFIEKYDARDQVVIEACDYHDFQPKESYDVMFLSNILGDRQDMEWLLSRSFEMLESGGVAIVRNYVSDDIGDPWASVTILERYSRTGHKGKLTADIIDAMKKAGYMDIVELGRKESVVILRGNKP